MDFILLLAPTFSADWIPAGSAITTMIGALESSCEKTLIPPVRIGQKTFEEGLSELEIP
jgi:hypothetical protein